MFGLYNASKVPNQMFKPHLVSEKMQSLVWYDNINPRKYVFLGLFIQTLKGLKTVEESDGESLLVNSGSLHTTSWGKLYGSL